MTYSLNTIVLEPLSKNKPKNAVILCHGYGGDGNDISILANYWRAHLPVSYTHLRAHETDSYLVCRLLLEKKNIHNHESKN